MGTKEYALNTLDEQIGYAKLRRKRILTMFSMIGQSLAVLGTLYFNSLRWFVALVVPWTVVTFLLWRNYRLGHFDQSIDVHNK